MRSALIRLTELNMPAIRITRSRSLYISIFQSLAAIAVILIPLTASAEFTRVTLSTATVAEIKAMHGEYEAAARSFLSDRTEDLIDSDLFSASNGRIVLIVGPEAIDNKHIVVGFFREDFTEALVATLRTERLLYCVDTELIISGALTSQRQLEPRLCAIDERLTAAGPGRQWLEAAKPTLQELVCKGRRLLFPDPVASARPDCIEFVGELVEICTEPDTGLVPVDAATAEDAYQRADILRECVAARIHKAGRLKAYLAKEALYKALRDKDKIDDVRWFQESKVRNAAILSRDMIGQKVYETEASTRSLGQTPGYSGSFELLCSNRNDGGIAVVADVVSFEITPPDDATLTLLIPGYADRIPLSPRPAPGKYRLQTNSDTAAVAAIMAAPADQPMLIQVETDTGGFTEYVFPLIGAKEAIFKSLLDCRALQQQ